MQELIPINENEFIVYNYETKKSQPIIPQHLNNRRIKILITKTMR